MCPRPLGATRGVALGTPGHADLKPRGARNGHPPARRPGYPMGRRRNPSAGPEGPTRTDTPGAGRRDTRERGLRPRLAARSLYLALGPSARCAPRPWGHLRVAWAPPGARRPETPKGRAERTHPQGSRPGYPAQGRAGGTPGAGARESRGRPREPFLAPPGLGPVPVCLGIPLRGRENPNEVRDPLASPEGLGSLSTRPRAFGPCVPSSAWGPRGWPWGRPRGTPT